MLLAWNNLSYSNMKEEFLPLPAGFRMSDERRQLADFEKTLKTFQEWSDAGYKIFKGEKSVGRNKAGVCVFSGAQVVKYAPTPDLNDEYDEEEFDQDMPGNPADYGDS